MKRNILVINLLIFLSGLIGVIGALEIAKGAKLHELNFLHIKYNHLFADNVTLFSKEKLADLSVFEKNIANIKTQSLACLETVSLLEAFFMKLMGANYALELCRQDVQLAEQVIKYLEKYQAKDLDKKQLVEYLNHSVLEFRKNSIQVEAVIGKMINGVLVLTISLLVFKSLLIMGLGYLETRKIKCAYQTLQEAQKKLGALNDQAVLQKRELELIFNNVPARIWYKDDKNTILRLNKAAAESMGGQIKDFEAANTYDLFPAMAKKYHEDDLEVIRSCESKLNIIEEYTPKNGKKGWVRTDKIPFKDPVTHDDNLLVISQDITELKHKEADLENSNKELEQFAYIASHDLQEPLRTLSTFSELLIEDHYAVLNDEAQDYIDRIKFASLRMSQLIKDLSEYSRLGKSKLKPEKINMLDLFEDVRDDLLLKVYEVQAVLKVRDDLPLILGERRQVYQVLLNLISNAIKFRKEKETPKVEFRFVKIDSNYAFFEVEDNGIGFDSEQFGDIVKPFHRLHSKDKFEGSGIGLSICNKIIKMHGGQFSVDSQVGRGSCFSFSLPLWK